jgi:hypothetical protein
MIRNFRVARMMFIDAAIIVEIFFCAIFFCNNNKNKRARNSFGSFCSSATRCYVVSSHDFHARVTSTAARACSFRSSATRCYVLVSNHDFHARVTSTAARACRLGFFFQVLLPKLVEVLLLRKYI